MPKLPGISRAIAGRVFTKLGFRIAHEGKPAVRSNVRLRLTIPRHNSSSPFTRAGLAKEAGLTPEQFRELMYPAMNADLQYDVFLSHSAKDKAVVRPLAERLRKDGLKVWFDEWVLKPGDSIPANIVAVLEHSRVPACPTEASSRRRMLCMSANEFGKAVKLLEFSLVETGLNRLSMLMPQRKSFPSTGRGSRGKAGALK